MNLRILRIVGVALVLVLAFSSLAACGAKTTETPQGEEEAGEASGETGPAVNLTGDATAGAAIFKDNCEECHGKEGVGGVENPGAAESPIPALNPLDPVFLTKEAIDKFIEHGATPEGDNPAKVMKAFGDEGILTPQQIADVIAYVLSLNQK